MREGWSGCMSRHSTPTLTGYTYLGRGEGRGGGERGGERGKDKRNMKEVSVQCILPIRY